ncbi:MAG: PHB depolymerase family esterase [Leptothrix sp. (in: b-proteobacteria)]
MKISRSLIATALLASGLLSQGVQAADTLPSFKIDAAETSVSGLSSGAFMAVQLQVAYSASIKGAGVVAGGPYYCAAGNMMYAGICMGQMTFLPPNPALMVSAAKGFAKVGQIDALSNLKKRHIYVFSGTKDSVVYQPAVDATVSFFKQVGVPEANLAYVNKVPAGHAVITPSYGNSCDANEAPYISHCEIDGQGYDQAGALLKHIYGDLQPKANALAGRLVTFDQRKFAAPITGMADEAFLYVPKACDAGETCKVHVAIHGCVQSAESVGKQFIADTGYNEWAENNHLLVLYPQVNKSQVPFNPQGCWDWFGYTGANYAAKSGLQMMAIKSMITALAAKK